MSEDINRFWEKIIYLDSKELSRLYSGITGIRGRPITQIESLKKNFNASLNIFQAISFGGSQGESVSVKYEISDSYLLESLLPDIEKYYYTKIQNEEDFSKNEGIIGVWITGTLTKRRFPAPYPYDKVKKIPCIHNELLCFYLSFDSKHFNSIHLNLLDNQIYEEENIKEPCKAFGRYHIANSVIQDAGIRHSKNKIGYFVPIFIWVHMFFVKVGILA
ncbi:MAG: hypothetical protein K8T10_15175 [Candidatus Eremiobacteraeota bacterium]|nr:hypothetical protein [Candidatus Eremiobacteraeota bacterium]